MGPEKGDQEALTSVQWEQEPWRPKPVVGAG